MISLSQIEIIEYDGEFNRNFRIKCLNDCLTCPLAVVNLKLDYKIIKNLRSSEYKSQCYNIYQYLIEKKRKLLEEIEKL